jgi:3-(3-hydroxy-phenyl)propionate hydroxylase
MGSYSYATYAFVRPPELDGAGRTWPVAIIGAGPVGLTLALDLATRGVPVVVLDDADVVSVGSRAICWAKRTLEIWDRLGVAARMVEKGVTWQVGRVFHGERELYRFDLLPEGGHRMPAFINLQQYYVEQYLIERCADFPDLIELRWRSEVVSHEDDGEGITLSVSTPEGPYRLRADRVVACDGARSPTRRRMGLAFPGQVFEERFLIADVRMEAPFPNERLFWFDPPFHAGGSALLHKQPDDVYRLDFQLGPAADPEAERRPERVMPRVRAVVGETPFELEWCSVYAFRCARMERFVHGRVIFAGDSAHVVSPFGARGGNGGIQDADNLGWKLAAIARRDAPPTLLDSYDEERGRGADENISNSARTTTFMTPKSATEARFRDGVLALAPTMPFARALLNAGRLSKPCTLSGLPLQGEGHGVGEACPDAPVLVDGIPGWLLAQLEPNFTAVTFAAAKETAPDPAILAHLAPNCRLLVIWSGEGALDGIADAQGLVAQRYGAAPGTTILIRPDQHVAARWDRFDPAAIAEALARAKSLLPALREKVALASPRVG